MINVRGDLYFLKYKPYVTIPYNAGNTGNNR